MVRLVGVVVVQLALLIALAVGDEEPSVQANGIKAAPNMTELVPSMLDVQSEGIKAPNMTDLHNATQLAPSKLGGIQSSLIGRGHGGTRRPHPHHKPRPAHGPPHPTGGGGGHKSLPHPIGHPPVPIVGGHRTKSPPHRPPAHSGGGNSHPGGHSPPPHRNNGNHPHTLETQPQAHAWPDPPQPITKSHDYGMWLENAFKAGQIALEQYNAGKQREQELKMAEMQMGAGPPQELAPQAAQLPANEQAAAPSTAHSTAD